MENEIGKNEIGKNLSEAIYSLEEEKILSTIKGLIDKDADVTEVVNSLTITMQEVGEKFEKGEMFLPELVVIGEAVQKGISEILEPELKRKKIERKTKGKIVIGTVEGDIHDIGKNITASLLATAGFEVFNLGKDVPVEKFIEKVKEVDADIVGASAMLTTTMVVQKKIIDVLKKEGLRDRVKAMVGGAPTSSEWADQIGADAYGESGTEATHIAEKLVKELH